MIGWVDIFYSKTHSHYSKYQSHTEDRQKHHSLSSLKDTLCAFFQRCKIPWNQHKLKQKHIHKTPSKINPLKYVRGGKFPLFNKRNRAAKTLIQKKTNWEEKYIFHYYSRFLHLKGLNHSSEYAFKMPNIIRYTCPGHQLLSPVFFLMFLWKGPVKLYSRGQYCNIMLTLETRPDQETKKNHYSSLRFNHVGIIILIYYKF